MSPFAWHISRILPFVVLVFTVSLIVFTILFSYEVGDAINKKDTGTIDEDLLNFVRYGHFIEAGFLGLGLLAYFLGSGTNMYLSHRMKKVSLDDVNA